MALTRVILLGCVLGLSVADLPVHCPHHKIKGKWEFTMSKGIKDKSLRCNKPPTEKQLCFYGSCFENKYLGEADFEHDHKWTVTLVDPNVAVAEDHEGNTHKGTWTVVYDEGFEVDVKDRKFFAFSKFGGGKSICDKTWPGWHRDAKDPDKQAYGCYTASKLSEEVDDDDIAFLAAEAFVEENENKPTKAYRQGTSDDDTVMYQPEHELVARINAKATTWKAKVYPEFEKYTMAEFQRMAGFKPVHKVERRPLRDTESLVEVDESSLPKTWDWRDVDGQNYMDAVIDQGGCGACYAVSTASMINSRLRIATKNRQKVTVNSNQILKCNRYSQACAGGFPFLVEKYIQEFGLTKSGECAKSQASLDHHLELGETNQAEQHNPFVRVTDFEYVGGYYGGTTTAQMMKEIHEHGPIVVGLNGGFEMMHYDTGIFIQTGEGSDGKGIRNDFESVSHAVLAVGWGEEGDNKYWILKNSFGAGWGEGGYFRVGRGGDVDGILSLVTAAKPVFGKANYFEQKKKDDLFVEAQEAMADADEMMKSTDEFMETVLK